VRGRERAAARLDGHREDVGGVARPGDRLARPPPRDRTVPIARKDAAPLRLLWVTPLRALAADTELALREPIDAFGLPWTLESRTGDTSSSRRARQRERLPTALITTPESLSLLLCREDAATFFGDLDGVLVDEWHELLSTKRGTQVELALARFRRWRPSLRTWGLSATLGNLDEAAAALGGLLPDGTARPMRLVRGRVPKTLAIESVIPAAVDRFPWAGHLGTRLVPDVLAALEEGRTALLFTNTRAQAEPWYQALLVSRPELEDQIALHHGSLDKTARVEVEARLKAGTVRCVVCTSSLDLGVDFSPVDAVFQVGSPKGVARLVQRAGRSGHAPGQVNRIRCVPSHAFELVEVAAARDAATAGRIKPRAPVIAPLDVLAQHLVTYALGGGFDADALFTEVRTTLAYRDLSSEAFRWVLRFVAHGGEVLAAYPEYQKLVQDESGTWRVASRQVAPRRRLGIGTVEESFVARLRPGDRFLFAGKPLEFVRARDLVAWVRRARSTTGAVPRWMGGRMPLSSELATAVAERLRAARRGRFDGPEMRAIREVLAVQAAWSEIPDGDRLLIERVRTREGHHLFFFPFAGRLVHEGLAALFAYRLGQLAPLTMALTVNDYGLELLAPDPMPLEEGLAAGLLSPRHLEHDLANAMNAAELARRQFREVARVAGLIFTGYPGAAKTVKQVQASSGLLFDVFARHDPGNLLLAQAHREVLERQFERARMEDTLTRLAAVPPVIRDVDQPTPLAFPILVDRIRETLTTEPLADRVRKMTVVLERAAG
jgi:ATP-dependent helicase Lhr and Lhr-like helicase